MRVDVSEIDSYVKGEVTKFAGKNGYDVGSVKKIE